MLVIPALAWLLAAGCARHTPESRVRSIEAHIDGITCPTCVPPLKASLKRQYGSSNIEVSDDKDTASVTFAAEDAFSPADFRAAVERVKMRVVAVRMEACGTVEAADGDKWLVAGSNRFRVRSERDVPAGAPLCASGTLDTRADPATFQVSTFSLAADAR
jgi:copper chaperone CopZ